MKRILVLLITVSLFAACSSTKSTGGKKAKVFNGKIVYALSYDGEVTPAQIAQMPNTVEISAMEDRYKIETIMAGGSRTIIFNGALRNQYELLDFGEAMRFVIKTPFDSIPKDTSASWTEDYTLTEETKTIAEYVCKKAVVTATMEGEDDRMYNVYYCPELGVFPEVKIHADEPDETPELNGVPMEFVEYAGDIKIIYTAKEVKKGSVKDYDFLKPSDFKEVTMEELRSMFGG